MYQVPEYALRALFEMAVEYVNMIGFEAEDEEEDALNDVARILGKDPLFEEEE